MKMLATSKRRVKCADKSVRDWENRTHTNELFSRQAFWAFEQPLEKCMLNAFRSFMPLYLFYFIAAVVFSRVVTRKCVAKCSFIPNIYIYIYNIHCCTALSGIVVWHLWTNPWKTLRSPNKHKWYIVQRSFIAYQIINTQISNFLLSFAADVYDWAMNDDTFIRKAKLNAYLISGGGMQRALLAFYVFVIHITCLNFVFTFGLLVYLGVRYTVSFGQLTTFWLLLMDRTQLFCCSQLVTSSPDVLFLSSLDRHLSVIAAYHIFPFHSFIPLLKNVIFFFRKLQNVIMHIIQWLYHIYVNCGVSSLRYCYIVAYRTLQTPVHPSKYERRMRVFLNVWQKSVEAVPCVYIINIG